MIAMVTLAVMVYATNPKVVHCYVAASAITDIPHWTAFLYVLGWDGIKQWRSWHTPLWCQLLVPVLTMVFKLGYLSGAFGEDRVAGEPVRKAKADVGRKEL